GRRRIELTAVTPSATKKPVIELNTRHQVSARRTDSRRASALRANLTAFQRITIPRAAMTHILKPPARKYLSIVMGTTRLAGERDKVLWTGCGQFSCVTGLAMVRCTRRGGRARGAGAGRSRARVDRRPAPRRRRELRRCVRGVPPEVVRLPGAH